MFPYKHSVFIYIPLTHLIFIGLITKIVGECYKLQSFLCKFLRYLLL
jgi:hypothetical protein